MGKGQKSSASSATRKKHARKAVGESELETLEAQPTKEKKPKGKAKAKAEPRRKIYTPPIKPHPIQPDPLDTLGIAYTIPSELLVILRLLGKKDIVSKTRALEELQSAWVDKAFEVDQSEHLVQTLMDITPVWLHHAPTLFLHPLRRIRILSAGLHSSLFRFSSVREQFLRDIASSDRMELVIGSWCMLSHDVDNQVPSALQHSWDEFVSFDLLETNKFVLDERLASSLFAFIQRTVLDPGGTYSDINPSQPVVEIVSTRRSTGQRQPSSVHAGKGLLETSRPNAEDELEAEQERNARLRIGAMRAMCWMTEMREKISGSSIEHMKTSFANPLLWTTMYEGENPPFVDEEGLGHQQPGVRKTAWSLLLTLLQNWKGQMVSLVPILSVAILRSAWVERDSTVRTAMWQPLLMFLKEYPQSWEIESRFMLEDDQSDSVSEQGGQTIDQSAVLGELKPSKSYREFLMFLEQGCWAPRQAYPSVIVILSTIPSSIMTCSSPKDISPLSELFKSFWLAVDARALTSLDRIPASTAFLSSLLECIAFIAHRLLKSPPEVARRVLFPAGLHNSHTEVNDMLFQFVHEQFGRICEELGSGHLRLDYNVAGKSIFRSLLNLEQTDQGLFKVAWDAFDAGINKIISSGNTDASDPVLLVLKCLHSQFIGCQQEAFIESSIRQMMLRVFAKCRETLASGDTVVASESSVFSTIKLMDLFGALLFKDPELSTMLHSLVYESTSRLVSSAPSLLLIYLTCAEADKDRCSHVWHNILSSLAILNVEGMLPALRIFLTEAGKGKIPAYLRPSHELELLASQLLHDSLAGQQDALLVCQSLFRTPGHFISNEWLEFLYHDLTHSFNAQFQVILNQSLPEFSEAIYRTLTLIESILEGEPRFSSSFEFCNAFIPEVFLLGHLLRNDVGSITASPLTLADAIWTMWSTHASMELRALVHKTIKGRLRDIILDVKASPRPYDILRLSSEVSSGIACDVFEILPPRYVLDKLLDALPAEPIDASLAIVDFLVPPDLDFQMPSSNEYSFDSHGYSSYARMAEMLLIALTDDRSLAKKHLWTLRHIISLSVYAEELLQVPETPNAMFNSKVISADDLRDINVRARQMTTYVLSMGFDANDIRWHEKVVAASLSDREFEVESEVGKFIVELIRKAQEDDTFRESRILHTVLQYILGGATKEEADHWLILARQLEKTAPQASMSIVLSITRFAPEPPHLERYRNELAAGVLGIRLSQINSEGLAKLHKLSVTAPDPDSEIVFLPQTRAVNLVKTCQQWAASDEDMDEALESELALLCFHLAPILQNVPGSHWDFIFDLIETNIENYSLEGNSYLVAFARSLRLVIVLEQLITTNRSLREVWNERRIPVLALIRDIAATPLSSRSRSLPLSICRELLLSIVQNLPQSLINKDTLANMCHLLDDPSVEVQKMAYRLLHAGAKKRTEDLVIEAGVTTMVDFSLPLELVNFLQRDVDIEEAMEGSGRTAFGYMLGWMLLFDLFIGSSLKVKLGYINHLRDFGIIESHFLPNILNLLNLYGGKTKAAKLEVWGVDEYFIEFCDPENPTSLRLFAAHLYYRALLNISTLIRSWLFNCKDRQLSSTVLNYTSKHFSPLLVKTELARVKGPEAAELLDDEHLAIKVAAAVNEVTTSYTIDEQQIEMTLRIPTDWPLHAIEIRDPKKFGIREDKWRTWILGVQQITWSQNGSIVDGISLFKKNVAGHFAGLTECAICYSILNANDATLPSLPCSTCNNRFHGACLYEWFNSSHSSSCPLCRSTIIINQSGDD